MEKKILHLWEDDYLMLELLPAENLEFARNETKRISDFSREHSDGSGFTDITPVGEIPLKTIDRQIDVYEIERILEEVELQKITRAHVPDVGILEGPKLPLLFGNHELAIRCDVQNNTLKHLSIIGRTKDLEVYEGVTEAVSRIGETFELIAVNWYIPQYYDLRIPGSPEAFAMESCLYGQTYY